MGYSDRLYKFARLYKRAADVATEKWARETVEQAFEKVMGRKPTLAEAQLAQAVGKLESGYGRGWGKGKGSGSNNWGAVQYPKGQGEGKPGFMHEDTLAGTKNLAPQKYVTKFKAYSSAVDGAADMISIIFKTKWGPHELMPPRMLPTGKAVEGAPGRGELCLKAAAEGDITAFSSAMYHSSYFGGTAPTFSGRIREHAKALNAIIQRMSAALGEPQAATIKTQNCLPPTTNQEYIARLLKNDPQAGGEGVTSANYQSDQERKDWISKHRETTEAWRSDPTYQEVMEAIVNLPI